MNYCCRCGSNEYQPSDYPYCNTCFKDLQKQGLLLHAERKQERVVQRPQDNNDTRHARSEEIHVCEPQGMDIQNVSDICGQHDSITG